MFWLNCVVDQDVKFETPVAFKTLHVEDISDLSVEELRQEIERLGQETEGICKVQLEKST